VPNPLVINKPVTLTASGSDFHRKEIGTHIMAVWVVPAGEKTDVTIFGGPSIFHLSQDVMTATVPAGTQSITTGSERQSGTGFGGNVGVNGNYYFTPRIGAGVFIRYAGGSVDLPAASGADVGGLQIGGGLRLRFKAK
jgi:hypothetical protein